ncbi:hypothetical protein IAU60_000187 [Kwoniella sp. DSM 27419]
MTDTALYDHPLDPLSRPKAAFYGRIPNHGQAPLPDGHAEGSRDAEQRQREAHSTLTNGGPDGDVQFEPVTLKPSSPRINPFHLLSHPNSTSPLPPLPPHLEALTQDASKAQMTSPPDGVGDSLLAPVHITRVTSATVEVTTGRPEEESRQRIIQKVTSVFKKDHRTTDTITTSIAIPNGNGTGVPARSPIMQGAPPSPPISEAGELAEPTEESVVVTETTETLAQPIPDPPNGFHESPSIAHAFTAEPGDLGGSPVSLAPPVTIPRRVSSGSATSSRAGSLTLVRSGRLAPQRDHETPAVGLGFSKGKDLPDVPPIPINPDRRGSGGSLITATQPPRMVRRSTNPTPAIAAVPRSPLVHSQSTFMPSPKQQTTAIPGLEGAALASDILAQTELLRQQRLERRQKKASAASEVQPAPVAGADADVRPRVEEKPKRGDTEEAKVLVGNLIGEDHVNYVLMYNMLTGIRIGVSRCQAKIKRPLTDEDYLARHKFSFDIVGNELTPSARYDFKFKDYAPWVFRDLRDEHFHLDPADYLLSLTSKYILSELGSPGKSGSFFYFSRDYRFIIKTISHAEHKFLRSILKDYHQHVKSNPHTLLSRFYGLHRVKLPRGRKIHFVIMNNLFPPHRDIHETYDLKGSAFGREYPEEKAAVNPRAVLKDKNWVNRLKTLELGPEKRALLSEQLRRDMEFLKRVRVMDYSLLVGIHNMERGNRDNMREKQLSMFHPDMPPPRRKPSTIKGNSEASHMRKAIRRSDPKMLDVVSQLPSSDSADRRHFLFYQDEGGLRATDEANQNMDVIYYLGVIDICTPYNSVKKIEHLWKSMTEDRHQISCIDPTPYGQRFLNFLLSIMRGGDKSLRPPGLEEPSRSDVPEKRAAEGQADQHPLGVHPPGHEPGVAESVANKRSEGEQQHEHYHQQEHQHENISNGVMGDVSDPPYLPGNGCGDGVERGTSLRQNGRERSVSQATSRFSAGN